MPAPGLALGVVLVVLACAACTPAPILQRAIRARGGEVRSLARVSDADVQAMFPGAWQWSSAYLAPNRYAWSITTTTGVDHYLFDGEVVRAWVGGRQVGADATPSAPLRSHARFTAVANLDAILSSGATVRPMPAAELPAGVAAGVSFFLPPDGAFYQLGFDARLLLIWATGPFDLPQVGAREVTVRFDDYRTVGGLLLPFRTRYEIDAQPLATERARHMCPNDPALVPASFADPAALPDCAGP